MEMIKLNINDLFKREIDFRNAGKCPFCACDINTSDFKDPISVKEYEISGLCQSCQDDAFHD